MATIFRPPVITVVYARRKAQPEYIVRISALSTPNPAGPFRQDEWRSPARKPRSLTFDAVSLNASLYSVAVVARPFYQTIWPNAAIRLKPATVDTVQLLLPIYSQRPFGNSTEARSFARQSVKSDIYVNLLPLQNPPAVVASPFSNYEWRSAAKFSQSAKIDDIANFLLYVPPIFPVTVGPGAVLHGIGSTLGGLHTSSSTAALRVAGASPAKLSIARSSAKLSIPSSGPVKLPSA